MTKLPQKAYFYILFIGFICMADLGDLVLWLIEGNTWLSLMAGLRGFALSILLQEIWNNNEQNRLP